MNDKIQLKRGTLANWLKADPVLMDGEMALVATYASKPTVYDSQKVGDGIHKFSELEMLGYKCLQELGDSQQFPVSQKVVSDKLSDLSKQIYYIDGKEEETFNDTIESNGYYNSYSHKEQYKDRKIYKNSLIVFNATGLSGNTSITVEVRKTDTVSTYVTEFGALTADSPSLIVESWDYENCLYGFRVKNIGDPVSVTTEIKLAGKIEQIEAVIDTKILKPSSSKITINEGESYILTKNLDFPVVTLNMAPNSRIIFNGYTIACNYLTLISSFMEEDGVNNAPMLDFSKTGGFNVRVGTCNITAGLFRTDNNKLNIHSFSFDARYDLGVLSHFRNTEFYITKAFKALNTNVASLAYELNDNCSLYSINGSTIELGAPVRVKGKKCICP